jgi:hypothetical protein
MVDRLVMNESMQALADCVSIASLGSARLKNSRRAALASAVANKIAPAPLAAALTAATPMMTCRRERLSLNSASYPGGTAWRQSRRGQTRISRPAARPDRRAENQKITNLVMQEVGIDDRRSRVAAHSAGALNVAPSGKIGVPNNALERKWASSSGNLLTTRSRPFTHRVSGWGTHGWQIGAIVDDKYLSPAADPQQTPRSAASPASGPISVRRPSLRK